MLFKLLTGTSLKTFWLLACMSFAVVIFAQDTLTQNVPDTLLLPSDTLFPDTLLADTLTTDTIKVKTKSSAAIKAKVDYKAADSIRFDVKSQKVYLYHEADINYEDINLKSAFVEIDFDKNIAYAEGLPDTAGKVYGDPEFTEAGQNYKSKTMKYNFNTKKGYIQKVFTEDGEGYLHGEIIKKMENDEINIKNGSYTTCNLEDHPHFEFKYYKSKVIPGEKIITGPAYLTIEEVPTPLFIPFGLFPNQTGQRSGIIIPTYGESANRGFYFENGGYYWAASDYFDLKVVGDIYTRGSWAVKPSMNYAKRYKFRGNLALTYAINKIGNEGSADYQESKDFAIRWSHSQDPKARPNSKFSANVNIVSNQYNTFNPSSTQDYLSNTFQSSVAYQTNFANKYFLTVNASHSQNTNNKSVTMTLPEMTFSVNRFYPLRSKASAGTPKWYENISVNYTMNSKNTVTVHDSIFFKPGFSKHFRNGIKHSVPISSTIKVMKYFNLTNSVKIDDRMYFETIRKHYVDEMLIEGNDTTYGYVKTDTIGGFRNAVDFSFSSSLTTKLYGMVAFEKGPVRAIRHVFTPTVSFSYRPDFADEKWDYYKYYYTDETHTDSVRYSIFEGGVYGSPQAGESGRVNFSFSNNLEIKVPSKKDTVTGLKKISLIDNFTISTSYDLAKDSMNWSLVTMSGRTRLFKGMDLTYSSSWDPYVKDSSGRRINKFEWDENRRLLRLDNTTWNVSLRYSLNSTKLKGKGKDKEEVAEEDEELTDGFDQEEFQQLEENKDDYIDWSIPWDLSFNYTLRYTNTNEYLNNIKTRNDKLIQTLSFNGNISITPKWKIGFRSGYDFEQGKLSYTSLNIYRDLHCWEMRFNWIPMGPRKSWNFALNVKSTMLQDMKLTKKKDFRDY